MLRRYDLKKKKEKNNYNYNENKSSTVLDLAQFFNTTNKTLCFCWENAFVAEHFPI